MIHLRVIAVGKTPADWRRGALNHYVNLVSPLAKLELITVKAQRVRQEGDIKSARTRETESLLDALSDCAYSFGLDATGKQYSTEALAKRFQRILETKSDLDFVIGGPYGLDASQLQDFDEVLSLSAMTLPHDLVRIVLLEQIYRALTIIRGHPYHK
jgi:23S rRNA (pseudouridine1915-N3)-methyltransferase